MNPQLTPQSTMGTSAYRNQLIIKVIFFKYLAAAYTFLTCIRTWVKPPKKAEMNGQATLTPDS